MKTEFWKWKNVWNDKEKKSKRGNNIPKREMYVQMREKKMKIIDYYLLRLYFHSYPIAAIVIVKLFSFIYYFFSLH